MDWLQLLGWLCGLAAGSATIVSLGKKVAEKLLDAGVEQYRAKLAHENSIELERLRSQLAIVAHKDQTQSAILLARQAEVIAKMYELLVNTEERCSGAIGLLEWAADTDEAQQEYGPDSAIRDMAMYYDRNRIYFSESVTQSIDQIRAHLNNAWHTARWASEQFKRKSPKGHETAIREWQEQQEKAWKIVSETVPEARVRLETQFRQLLGVVAGDFSRDFS